MTFDDAMVPLLRHEGGYVNDPRDPGGETYRGITRRDHPDWIGWVRIDPMKSRPDFPRCLDAFTPLLDVVKALYLRDYWTATGCDALPPTVADEVFDMAVNSGAGNAARCLQRALKVADDGHIGPITRAKAAQADPRELIARFEAHRLLFLTRLTQTWPAFGRGWAARIAQEILDGMDEADAEVSTQ